MKKFIILLISIMVFFIPIAYGRDTVGICTSEDSSTAWEPAFRLNVNKESITKGELYYLPDPGTCRSASLRIPREKLVKKIIHVGFEIDFDITTHDIGTLSFDSIADFESCEVYIKYISGIFSYKARASKVCTSNRDNLQSPLD